MNKTETVLLCRYAKAMCPAQAIDEYTPDAWADVLHDVSLEEAQAAIREGIRNRGWRFIDITEVIDGARQSRRQRLAAWVGQFGPLIPPYSLGGDVTQELAWLATARRRILDGEVTHPDQLGALEDADLQLRDVGALGQIGQKVPRS